MKRALFIPTRSQSQAILWSTGNFFLDQGQEAFCQKWRPRRLELDKQLKSISYAKKRNARASFSHILLINLSTLVSYELFGELFTCLGMGSEFSQQVRQIIEFSPVLITVAKLPEFTVYYKFSVKDQWFVRLALFFSRSFALKKKEKEEKLGPDGIWTRDLRFTYVEYETDALPLGHRANPSFWGWKLAFYIYVTSTRGTAKYSDWDYS